MRERWYNTLYMFIRIVYKTVFIMYSYIRYDEFVHVSIRYLKTAKR